MDTAKSVFLYVNYENSNSAEYFHVSSLKTTIALCPRPLKVENLPDTYS